MHDEVCSLLYLCMYLLLVIIADYSKSTYHASDSLAGLVVGLFINLPIKEPIINNPTTNPAKLSEA
jgi:hypothetical protein